jgi:hypothetical protein
VIAAVVVAVLITVMPGGRPRQLLCLRRPDDAVAIEKWVGGMDTTTTAEAEFGNFVITQL